MSDDTSNVRQAYSDALKEMEQESKRMFERLYALEQASDEEVTPRKLKSIRRAHEDFIDAMKLWQDTLRELKSLTQRRS